jgi:NAD(P)H dehydrogenase (quinone)
MDTLVVTAHPDPESLTHHAAARLRDRLGEGRAGVAHLAQEGFDPRFTAADRRGYLTRDPPAPDVAAEQRRIDEVRHLVLVFPVYWWSMPALLKGWIDRVFIAGWAFDLDADQDRIVPRLGALTGHLLPVSGTSAASFARHGYTESFGTQIERGILDYCGVRRGATAFVHDSESGDRVAVAREVETAVGSIVAAIAGDAQPVVESGSLRPTGPT